MLPRNFCRISDFSHLRTTFSLLPVYTKKMVIINPNGCGNIKVCHSTYQRKFYFPDLSQKFKPLSTNHTRFDVSRLSHAPSRMEPVPWHHGIERRDHAVLVSVGMAAACMIVAGTGILKVPAAERTGRRGPSSRSVPCSPRSGDRVRAPRPLRMRGCTPRWSGFPSRP